MASADASGRVRPATTADIPALVTLDRMGGKRSAAAWQSELDRPVAWVSVATVAAPAGGEAVVGFTVSWNAGMFVELHDVVVAPTARRGGHGRRLLRALADQARAAGAMALELEVRVSNVGAQALYEAEGYVAVGLRKNYYHDGEGARLYTLALV